VDGKKMSKSLGNFYTLRQILEKGFTGREIRYELIGTHYRQQLNFTFASLTANRAALARLDEFYAKVQEAVGNETRPPKAEAVSKSGNEVANSKLETRNSELSSQDSEPAASRPPSERELHDEGKACDGTARPGGLP
jgi:cysteinyl-tRNA synthetase